MVKVYVLVILVLSGLVHSQAMETPTTTDLNCDLDRNPALKTVAYWAGIQESDLQLRTEVNYCKGEWSVYKTCCPTAPIKQYIDYSVGTNPQANWHSYMAKVNGFKKGVVAKLKTTMAKISAGKGKWAQKASKSPKKGGCAMDNFSSNTIDHLKYFSDNYDKYQDEYRDNAQKCFNELKAFKANSLCTVCSGRGWQMLATEDGAINAGTKVFNVKTESCRRILTSCGKVFRFSYFLQEAIQLVQSLRINYGQSKKNRNCIDNFDSYRNDEINVAFTQCVDGSIDSCTDPNVIVLCKSFLKVGPSSKISEGDATLVDDETSENTEAAGNLIDSRILQSADAGTFVGYFDVTSDSSVNSVGSTNLFNGQSGAVPDATVSTSYLVGSSFGSICSVLVMSIILICLTFLF